MAKRKTMRMETIGNSKRSARSASARDLGLRRTRLRKRWSDETAYIMSNPADVAWIMAAKAQLDRWRELSGTPPFDPHYADDGAP
jgi:hypothetical protein